MPSPGSPTEACPGQLTARQYAGKTPYHTLHPTSTLIDSRELHLRVNQTRTILLIRLLLESAGQLCSSGCIGRSYCINAAHARTAAAAVRRPELSCRTKTRP